MRFHATLALGFASILAAGAPMAQAEDAAKDCKLHRLAAFDVTIDRAGLPEIPVTIAGKSVSMILDTGSLFSAVSETTMKDLGLTRVSMPPRLMRMYDGTPITSGASGQGFMIGRLPIPNYAFMVLPDKEGRDLGGLLGEDLLSVFDIDIDFGTNKLNLLEPNSCGEGAVYWASNYAKVPISFGDTAGNTDSQISGNASTGSYTVTTRTAPPIEDKHIYTVGQVDGTEVKIGIDTGSSTSAITMKQAQHVFKWSSDQPGLTQVNANNKDAQPVYSYPFKTLTLGGITVNNPRIRVLRVPNDYVSEKEDILLGMDVLRQLHVYIAYKDKVMYVTPKGAKPDAAPPPAAKAN